MAGIFLAAGIFGLVDRVATISADLHARRTWPSVDGEIVSANQTDDDANPSFKVSLSDRKRYWVEYEVRFAVPEEQCRTGIIYTRPSETMPCYGIIRTRSTQSTYRAYDWLMHGYHVNERVKVLYNPNGPEIKIAGESIWLRYNTDRLMLNALWVLVFFALCALAWGCALLYVRIIRSLNRELSRLSVSSVLLAKYRTRNCVPSESSQPTRESRFFTLVQATRKLPYSFKAAPAT
jgi:Protein of unknown function (DUF3592)